MAKAMTDPDSRFWPKVDRGNPDTCWPWLASKDRGYGYFGIRRDDGKWVPMLAHVYSYVRRFGPVPSGMELDHTCRNRGCVNPAHREPVTHAVNKARAFGDVCPNGHLRTPETIVVNNVGGRGCRICHRLAVSAHRLRQTSPIRPDSGR